MDTKGNAEQHRTPCAQDRESVSQRDIDRRIDGLHAGVQSGAYRAQPFRRSYNRKDDGGKCTLGVARSRTDRPEGGVGNAERDLREGIPRVLSVPAGVQPARRSGRADRRDHQQESELHPRRRHPSRPAGSREFELNIACRVGGVSYAAPLVRFRMPDNNPALRPENANLTAQLPLCSRVHISTGSQP
jgi:hypothetical protein